MSVDAIYKCLLLGSSLSGKTSLLLRFTEKMFFYSSSPTIGVDFKVQNMYIFTKNYQAEKQAESKTIRLQIWDTAGQERFQTIIQAYYRSACGVMLVFDVSNRATFFELYKWYDEVLKHCSLKIKILLVGNKADLRRQETQGDNFVTLEEALTFAQTIHCPYIETSAKTNLNVYKAFEDLTMMMWDTRGGYGTTDQTKIDIVLTPPTKHTNTKVTTSSFCCFSIED